MEVTAERVDDLFCFVFAQQTVIDEHAGQLVADSLVNEQRRHGRVDTPAQCTQHALATDLRTDALDLFLDHRGRCPRGRRAGEAEEEVLQHLLTVRRMDHLGMELYTVEPALGGLERRDRRRG